MTEIPEHLLSRARNARRLSEEESETLRGVDEAFGYEPAADPSPDREFGRRLIGLLIGETEPEKLKIDATVEVNGHNAPRDNDTTTRFTVNLKVDADIDDLDFRIHVEIDVYDDDSREIVRGLTTGLSNGISKS